MNGSKWLVVVAVLGLGGCATPRVESIRAQASSLYQARSPVTTRPGANPATTDGVLTELLTRPVDADAAVQIALLKNPRVESIYSRLGFARADLYDAARLSNPALGYVHLAGKGSDRKTDWSLSQNFTELLFLRFRKAGAASQTLLAEQQVARELLDLEADVRAAHTRYVGSRTVAAMRDRISESAQVSAGYAQQLFTAGNISKLQLARMQEADDIAKSDALRAHASETADRNALLTRLGMGSEQSIDLVGDFALPDLNLPATKELQAWALGNRLDLLSAREALRFASIATAHTRRWRWLGDTSIGVAQERDGTNGRLPSDTLGGPSASLAVPIFNQGAGAVGRVQSTGDALAADVHSLELSIGNEIATRVAALEAARQTVALYREKIVPVQRTIVDEAQKQQNYMLIGTFELLTAKQHQYEGYEAYISALRDYWLAYVDLIRATGGRFPGWSAPAPGPRAEPLAAIESVTGDRP